MALGESRVSHGKLLDGAHDFFGGDLLLTPGFLTDILGIVLLLPPTRALVRGVVARRVLPRLVVTGLGGLGGAAGAGAGRRRAPGDADVEGTATEVDPQARQLP